MRVQFPAPALVTRKHLPRTDAFRGSDPAPRNPVRYLRHFTSVPQLHHCGKRLVMLRHASFGGKLQNGLHDSTSKEQDFSWQAGGFTPSWRPERSDPRRKRTFLHHPWPWEAFSSRQGVGSSAAGLKNRCQGGLQPRLGPYHQRCEQKKGSASEKRSFHLPSSRMPFLHEGLMPVTSQASARLSISPPPSKGSWHACRNGRRHP